MVGVGEEGGAVVEGVGVGSRGCFGRGILISLVLLSVVWIHRAWVEIVMHFRPGQALDGVQLFHFRGLRICSFSGRLAVREAEMRRWMRNDAE